MRHSFLRHRAFLGVLMACVLMFGVQGVVDALTLSKTSGDLQSKAVGSSLEISFSVGLKSRQPIREDGQLVTEDLATRIDSSGYKVQEAGNGSVYRTTENNTLTAITDTGYAQTGYSKVGTYNAVDKNYSVYSGNVLADSRRRAYAESGEPLYYITADNDTSKGNQAQVLSEHFEKVEDKVRFHYNEEAIMIKVDPQLTDSETLDLKGYGEIDVESGQTHYRIEEGVDGRLSRSVTLSLNTEVDSTPGKFVITISDDTPMDDIPSTVSKARDITFTLYVGGDDTDNITITAPDPSIYLPTDESHQIDSKFTVTIPGSAEIPSVVYQVTDGPGTLFVKLSDDRVTSPVTQLVTTSEAAVFLNVNGGSSIVTLSLVGDNPRTDGARITFYYEGRPVQQRPQDRPSDTTPTVSVSPISLSGAPGDIREITVSPSNARVTSSSAFRTEDGGVSTTGTVRTVRLPDRPGTYRLTFDATNYNPQTISVRVTGEAADEEDDEDDEEPATGSGTLTITEFGDQVGTQQQINVSASPRPSSDVPFTVSIGGIQVTSGTISTTGRGSALVEVPTTGLYTLTVRASGYTTRSVTFTAGTSTATPPTTPVTPPASTISEPSRVTIGNQATRTGTLDTVLETPLLVQVLDDDGNGVADTYVTFRVRTGQGRLSQLGNGRATVVETDARGFARAPYTPLSASSTVEASIRGVARTATFTITTGSAPPATTPTTTPTPGDPTPSTTISPVVQVNAANRPPMVWVDGGAIYALVGANVQRFAPGIDTAMNIAISGNKVYWTEQTGESAGTINSANLNGSGVKELTAIMAVPRGIVVDTDNSKLYWTNSRGRIQSANLDGSGIRNVLENLPDLIDIAIDRGVLYWTQYNATSGTGNVGILNPTGQRNARYVSTGADMPGSIVIGSGKVYWTEQTGTSSGTINAANLNGNGATQLASILAAPSGIAVDASRSKLYWTNSRGRIQSANLDGSGIQNVVDGLGSPGDMVLSNSISAPATTSTPTTAANKYDVNGDGTVDVRDSDAIIVAVAAGVTDAKYDVNGDGKVDISDVVAVTANRNGAAGAPTLHGLKFSALEIDRLQEQINLLVATDDRSPAAMRTLIYLQQLIVMARPEKTQLLANYPNPFNPETWIPYQLATDTNVRITIYNTHGVVIRTLELGHQSSGYYTGRDRAAYWDGRNAYGEQVASGIYFYQFETDTMSTMRKMVILK